MTTKWQLLRLEQCPGAQRYFTPDGVFKDIVSAGLFRRLISTAVTMTVALALLLPTITFGVERSDSDDDKQFILRKGRGVAVCEAYLELLNQTPVEDTPFCGRPENGPEPKFIHLDRQYLNVDQVYALFTPVWEFMQFNDQHHVERVFHSNRDPKKSYWSAEALTRDDVINELPPHEVHIWRYTAGIDIANDGMPLQVLIWQGYGATGKGGPCGESDRSVWTDTYIEQHAYILNADGKSIDEPRTRAIFGESAKGPSTAGPLSHVPFALPQGATPFKPMADSIGIFGYRGKYYIQTEDMPKTRTAKPGPVEVYLREHNRTSRMCAYRPDAVPVPSQYPGHD